MSYLELVKEQIEAERKAREFSLELIEAAQELGLDTRFAEKRYVQRLHRIINLKELEELIAA